MLVVDASTSVQAAVSAEGFAPLAEHELVAPALMWPQARAALHQAARRGELPAEDAREAHRRLERSPVEAVAHPDLGETAWAIADELGLVGTYESEYLALARLLGCRVLTLDGRLVRRAAGLGLTITPGQLL